MSMTVRVPRHMFCCRVEASSYHPAIDGLTNTNDSLDHQNFLCPSQKTIPEHLALQNARGNNTDTVKIPP